MQVVDWYSSRKLVRDVFCGGFCLVVVFKSACASCSFVVREVVCWFGEPPDLYIYEEKVYYGDGFQLKDHFAT